MRSVHAEACEAQSESLSSLASRSVATLPCRGGGQAPAARSDTERRPEPEANRRAGACPPPHSRENAPVPITLPVFDIQRFSVHDGPGIRTTVFLEGCPLRCAWCQNPEALRTGRAPLLSLADVLTEVSKDRPFYDASGGGLTLSGGEPLLHRNPVRALLEQAKRAGLHTCVQTSGAVPEANLAAVLDVVDLFQFDLKHMGAEQHHALTGEGTERIHQSAAFLLEHGANVQFRMPLVPGVNDDASNLDAVAGFLLAHGVRALRLVPYQRLYLGKLAALGLAPKLPHLEPPSPAALRQATELFQRHGIAVFVDG